MRKLNGIAVVARYVLLLMLLVWVLMPIYLAVVAASHPAEALMRSVPPLLPGNQWWHNNGAILTQPTLFGGVTILRLLFNSLCMAVAIAAGKVLLAVLSAFALVYFDFAYRQLAFFIVMMTLMVPIEVRIVPTFEVVSNLHLVGNFAGLTLPILASATSTFLFRQTLQSLPNELHDAAVLDGAGPWRFLIDVLLPVTKTAIVALFIIMFIYGWNQYLWPLVTTNYAAKTTIVMGIKHLIAVNDEVPQWHYVMLISLWAMMPPGLVILLSQRFFEKGLVGGGQ